MACGHCGHALHRLYRHEESNSILVECCKCKSVSMVTTYEPRLQVEWTDNSDGRLTVMKPIEE